MRAISALVAARNQATEHGAAFRIDASDPVAHILDIVGLTGTTGSLDPEDQRRTG